MANPDLMLSQLVDALVAARMAATSLGLQSVCEAVDLALNQTKLHERKELLAREQKDDVGL